MERKIYLAGGCFWGVEKYFKLINGIASTRVGYANGTTKRTTYEDVKDTMHAETVELTYDDEIISLSFILDLYYEIIDPTTLNQQGNDIGTQYRSGIYYIDNDDETIITQSLQRLKNKYKDHIVVEVEKLKNFVLAEGYHQNYLDKNPRGYCHIDDSVYERAKAINEDPYLVNK